MIFIDSDGCIANFIGWCRKYDPTITGKDHERIWKVMAEHADTCFGSAETPLMPDAAVLLNLLKRPGVFVLTALTKAERLAPYCNNVDEVLIKHRKNKIKYFTNLGIDQSKIIIVDDSSLKSAFAAGGNILLDDYIKNIENWTAAGGIGILINPTEKTPLNRLNGVICL